MPKGRRRSSVSAAASSAALDQPYVGSVGSQTIDSDLPSPQIREEEDRKQAELDQQFFAPSSPAHEPQGGQSLTYDHTKDKGKTPSEDGASSPLQPEAAPSTIGDDAEVPKPSPSASEVPLPSYNPLPFDFSVLEDFATKEREQLGLTVPVPGAGPSTGASNGPTVSFSPERSNELRSRRTGEDGEAAAGIKAGRMGRARKLSESVATPGSRGGRYQRKLALFEGSGTSTAATDRPAPSVFSPTATSRTPLMSQAQADKDYFGSMSQHPGLAQRSQSGHRSRSADEKGASYRFSFYSNALPTTVHTKHLSELPNEGESFQELFMGANPQQHGPAHSAFLADPVVDPSAQASARTSVSGTGGINVDRLRTQHALMRPSEDFESNTWWLDVLCPSDTEMKVLSKVPKTLLFIISLRFEADFVSKGFWHPSLDHRRYSDGGVSREDRAVPKLLFRLLSLV